MLLLLIDFEGADEHNYYFHELPKKTTFPGSPAQTFERCNNEDRNNLFWNLRVSSRMIKASMYLEI